MLKDQTKNSKYTLKISIIDSKVTDDASNASSAIGSPLNAFNATGIKKVVKVNKDLTLKITEIDL